MLLMKKMAALFLIFASHRSFSSALTGSSRLMSPYCKRAQWITRPLQNPCLYEFLANTSYKWLNFFMAARKSRFVFAVSSSHSIIQTILCPLRHLRFSTALVNIVLCASFHCLVLSDLWRRTVPYHLQHHTISEERILWTKIFGINWLHIERFK